MNTPQDRSTTQGTHGRSSTGSTTQQGQNAQDPTDGLIEKTSSQGKAQLNQYREQAADKVDQFAEGIDKAASQLPDDDVLHVSEHISAMAQGLGRLSDGLREKSADQILRDVGRIARENPALFIGGSIAIGFGIARFARASAPSSQTGTSSSIGGGSTYGGTSSYGGASTRGGSTADEWMSGGRTGSSLSTGEGDSAVPGLASSPATGNDTIDTIAPSGSVTGTTGSIPGPAASAAGASLADASFPGSGSESGLAGSTTGLSGTVTGTTAGTSTRAAGTSSDYLSGSKPS